MSVGGVSAFTLNLVLTSTTFTRGNGGGAAVPAFRRTVNGCFLINTTIGASLASKRSPTNRRMIGGRFGRIITRGYVGNRGGRPRIGHFSFASNSGLTS